MAVVSALTMSVFLPKRITLAESQKNCSKSDLRNIQIYRLYNLLLGDSWLQKQNKHELNGSSVQNSTKKLAHLFSYLSRMESILHKRIVELSST